MKKIGLYILLIFTIVSCDKDGKIDMMIDTVVCIPNSGLQTVTSDQLADGVYKLSVYKGGYNDESVTVCISVDEVGLETYNRKNQTNYILLPGKYYTFDQQVVLSANTIQDVSNVKFDMAAMRADSIDASHVVSLVITAPAENKVNVNMNSVIIRVKKE